MRLGVMNRIVVVKSNLKSKFWLSILIRFEIQRWFRVDDGGMMSIFSRNICTLWFCKWTILLNCYCAKSSTLGHNGNNWWERKSVFFPILFLYLQWAMKNLFEHPSINPSINHPGTCFSYCCKKSLNRLLPPSTHLSTQEHAFYVISYLTLSCIMIFKKGLFYGFQT